ncbi:phage head closure protein [Halosquirtibacter xylanolyticus]|uniref:phage head closure protein n=1 Tax=Halosquirtibacter xylanolyticus TaxID=3374599 RepID=UPI00374A57EE|nr:phage head closure protein [Prolixibacteraceae bacterium]
MLATTLRTPITLFQKETESNSYGEEKEVYSPLLHLKCGLFYQKSNETLIGGELETVSQTIRFKIRFRKIINEELVILMEDQFYNIKSIEKDPRKHFMILEGTKIPKGAIKLKSPGNE